VETATIIPPLGPLGSLAAATATFIVTGDLDPDFTGPLTLTDGTFSTALAYTGNGAYTANLETWPDGTVTASLAVVDSYNNSFTTSTIVAIDTDYGETVGLSGPPGILGTSAAAAAKFVVTGNLDGETGSLTLTDGGSTTALAYTGNGTYTANLDTWTDGRVNALLTVSDPAGNSFTASTTAAIDPDHGETVTVAVSPTTETIGADSDGDDGDESQSADGMKSATPTVTFTISGLDVGDTGAGNTVTLVLTEAGQTNETFKLTPTATSGTYTEILGFTSAGTVTTSLTFTDAAGNSLTATGNKVTLVTTDDDDGGGGDGGDGNAVANSGTLEATGRGGLIVTGAVANSGTLSADGGNLTVEGAVGGSGGAGAEISGGATLEFGAASSANVGFAAGAGAAGMLKLDQASGFSGTVAGLGAGDAIDLADIIFGGSDTLAYAANAAGTGGMLTVGDGTHTANLALIGQYAAAEFATAPNPGGGTVVTYGQAPPPSGSTDQALLAHPHH
jgi:hypothetical protein